MDPDAPVNVARGTVITCLSSATLCSLYGTLRKQPIGPLASSAALNSGIVSATFFSLREYVVSPLLLISIGSGQFARRREQIQNVQTKNPGLLEGPTFSEMRLEKLPDTAISGAFAGSIFNGWKRGRPGIVPGAITASLLCSILQLGYNELRIWRVRYVSRQPGHIPPSSQPSSTPSITPLEPQRPFWERALIVFGMRKMTDEEYLRKMVEKRDAALIRIAQLEEERARSEGEPENNPPNED